MKNINKRFFKGLPSRFSATVMLFALGCVAAFAGSKLYIRDAESGAVNSFSIIPGEKKTVQVVLDNPDDHVSYLEFYLNFNKGLKYVDKSLTKVTDRITRDSHSLVITSDYEGVYHVGVISTAATMQSSAIKGQSGAILEFQVEADPAYAPDETAKIYSFSLGSIVACDATILDAKSVIINESEEGVSEDVYVSVAPFVGNAYSEQSGAAIRPLGTCDLGVSYANTIPVTNISCKVTLPDGLHFSDDGVTKGDRVSENVSEAWQLVAGEPNTYILLLSSLTNDIIEGNDGNIFTLNLFANKNFNSGKVVVSDIVVSSAYDVWYKLDDVLEYNVYSVTDPSGDGVWNIFDVTTVLTAIMNLSNDSTCDVNNDGKVNVFDYTATLAKVHAANK